MIRPKVSIIIPVYNSELYLEKCLDSVVNQTLRDIEIICINDGSVDRSLQILRKYAENDQRFSIIDQKNHGQGKSRNTAIDIAKGQYIGFVDSDDWIDTKMFDRLYYSAIKDQVDVTICEFALVEPETETMSIPDWCRIPFINEKSLKPFNWTDVKEFVFNINTGPFNKLYRRQLLINNDIRFAENVHYEDILFVYSAIFNSSKINFIDEVLYFYRNDRIGSVSSDKGRKQFDIFKVLALLTDKLQKIDQFDIIADRYLVFRFNKLMFHLDEISTAYKIEFWNQVKIEYKELNANQQQILIKQLPVLNLIMLLGLKPYLFLRKIKSNLIN